MENLETKMKQQLEILKAEVTLIEKVAMVAILLALLLPVLAPFLASIAAYIVVSLI